MSMEFNSIKRGRLQAIYQAEGLAGKSDEDVKQTTEITLWLDEDVIDKFKSYGDDWQTRVNAALRAAVAHGVAGA